MLPDLAGMVDPNLWFAKRCIKFINMCMKSDSNTVLTNYFYYGCEWIVLGYRVLCTKYGMNLNTIIKVWNERCVTE